MRTIALVIMSVAISLGDKLEVQKLPEKDFEIIGGRSFFHLLKHKLRIHVLEKVPTLPPTSNCICVPYYQCDANNTIITDGKDLIDYRFLFRVMQRQRRCPSELDICCNPPMTRSPNSMASIMTPTSTTTPKPSTTTPRVTTVSTSVSTSASTTTTTTTLRPFPTLPQSNCICVDRSLCGSDGFIIIAGEGLFNPRQGQSTCTLPNQICCRQSLNMINFPTMSNALSMMTSTTMASKPSTTVAPTISRQTPCICVKDYQCDQNGFVITSGAGILNARYPTLRQNQAIVLPTCAAGEKCCSLRINSNNGQSVMPIEFPSGPGVATLQGIIPRSNTTQNTIKNLGTPMACSCVKSWSCSADNVVVIDPSGIIDSRFRFCLNLDEVCCRLQGIQNSPQTVIPGNSVVVIQSGVVNPPPVSSALETCGRPGECLSGSCPLAVGETYFTEFPWMTAIILRQNDGSRLFLCGGSMINTRTVLTAAHCVLNRSKGPLVVRFGEWNTSDTSEPLPYQESIVESIVTHENYYKEGLFHDVAVLILSTPVQLAANIQPICLPEQGATFTPGLRCLASGWGRSGFEGKYQTTLKKIDLPLIEFNECQNRLRKTRLGEYFQLHRSFLCAGGELERDTCTGDGGGPLVCRTATGQFVQVGIVAWGIGCGASDVPAVYVNVAQHRQWINQQMANYGVA